MAGISTHPHVSEKRARGTANQYREFSGTPKKIIDKLKEWERAGMAYAIVNFADAAYDTSGPERFAREVIPAFATSQTQGTDSR